MPSQSKIYHTNWKIEKYALKTVVISLTISCESYFVRTFLTDTITPSKKWYANGKCAKVFI